MQAAADATAATVQLAIAEAEALTRRPLYTLLRRGELGEPIPISLVTDNGPAFKSAAFAAFNASRLRPELAHIRTRKKAPNTNGVRERGFGSLKYERLYREEITEGQCSPPPPRTTGSSSTTSAPTKASPPNRPVEVNLGQADPTIPTFIEDQILPKS